MRAYLFSKLCNKWKLFSSAKIKIQILAMNQIETLEDALEAVADSIDCESFVDYVRKGLEAGHDLNYKLTIKGGTQGIVVSFVAERKFPTRTLKTFIRLT